MSFRTLSRSATVLSRFANLLGQFPNFFNLIHGFKNELYARVSDFHVSRLKERGFYMYVLCSFRFVSETIKTLASMKSS